MSMIKIENLTFSYPTSYDNVFENVSFQVDTDWNLGFVDVYKRQLKYYQHKAPEVAERKAELNDVYWLIDQIIYGYERKDREMLIKGVSELLQTQAEMFIF